MRIFIEWTSTAGSGLNTGVQRVVRSLVHHAPSVGQTMGIDCVPVVVRQGHLCAADGSTAAGALRHSGTFRARANSFYWSISHALVARIPHPAVRRYLLANKHHPGLARLLATMTAPSIRAVRALRHVVKAPIAEGSDISVEQGDWLVLADGPGQAWNDEVIMRVKGKGARVATIVYDLLPILEPRYFEPASCRSFEGWIGRAIQFSDAFCCISHTVEVQLKRHFREQRSQRVADGLRIGSFPLGVEFETGHSSDRIRGAVKRLFDRPVFLVVGTLDPRKNHMSLLTACESAWARGFDGSLLIVGRVGWMCEDIVTAILALRAKGRPVFHFQDISDNELEYCYGHAQLLLFPSFAEGFGLPIIEALARRLPVIASDIPIFREVGQEDVRYFDPRDTAQLAELLMNWGSPDERSERAVTNRRVFPSWRHSAEDLLGLLKGWSEVEAPPRR